MKQDLQINYNEHSGDVIIRQLRPVMRTQYGEFNTEKLLTLVYGES